MNRFTRFSRISPARLLRSREYRAWSSLALTAGLLTGTSVLLALQSILIQQEVDTFFHGIAYTAPTQPQPPAQHLICRAKPPAPSITLQPVQPDIPDALLPEQVDDTELADIASEPLPPPLQAEWIPPRTPEPARIPTTPTATMAKATPAAPLRAPHPTYPPRMRQRRMEGDVGICIHIDATGAPTAVDILTEVHPDFAEHTRRWILQHWHFRAAHKGQHPIASTLSTTIRYRLE